MDYSRYEFIKVEMEDKVAIVTLNRPDRLNAIGGKFHDECGEIFGDIGRDARVKAMVLTGAGKCFSAGGDVKGMSDKVQDRDATTEGGMGILRAFEMAQSAHRDDTEDRRSSANTIVRDLIDMPQPSIAAVKSYCFGLGMSIALLCDIVIAGEDAQFGDQHVLRGLPGGGDGCGLVMPFLIGINKTKELCMTGDVIKAAEAYRLGLVNHLVPVDQVMPKAMEMAHRLANGPTRAIEWTKAPFQKILQQMVLLRGGGGEGTLARLTEDHREATLAFKEKRKPLYKGY